MPIRRRRNPGDILLKKTITLSDADIKTYSIAGQLEILPNPGIGKGIITLAALFVSHIVVGYTGVSVGDRLILAYDWAGAGASYIDFKPSDVGGFFSGSMPVFRSAPAGTGGQPTLDNILEKPVQLAFGNAVAYTGGDPANTLKVTVYYDILTL